MFSEFKGKSYIQSDPSGIGSFNSLADEYVSVIEHLRKLDAENVITHRSDF